MAARIAWLDTIALAATVTTVFTGFTVIACAVDVTFTRNEPASSLTLILLSVVATLIWLAIDDTFTLAMNCSLS